MQEMQEIQVTSALLSVKKNNTASTIHATYIPPLGGPVDGSMLLTLSLKPGG